MVDIPLRERTIHSRSKESVSARQYPAAHSSKPRKEWSCESMELALRDVTNGALSVRRAALEYGVPKSTLGDRVSGRVCPGAVGGPPRYLDDQEEEELVRFLIGCAEVGYAKSVREVRTLVSAIMAKKRGCESFVVSHGWWESFCRRHPGLSLRRGESLAYRRAVSTTREAMDRYFDLLEETLEKNDLTNRPSRIYNCNESGMPMDFRPGRRIAKRGQKHVYVYGTGNKAQVTILACVNAAGSTIPPLVIYSRKNLTKELTINEVPGTMYGLSTSGWIDGEIIYEWFESHFLLYAPAARPLLLLLDGHSSHYMPDFIRLAASKGVIVFCLPPNTTHVSQPLDTTVFHSLKTFWDQAVDQYMSSNPGKVPTIYQFNMLFRAAWMKAMTPANIIGGFHKTGVYPVDRAAIKLPGESQPKHRVSTPVSEIAKSKGIQYLPLYSPAPRRSIDHPTRVVSSPCFSQQEITTFSHRFEEGYDLKVDDRYNQWLAIYHPELASSDSESPPFSPVLSLSRELLSQSTCSSDEGN